MSQVLVIEPNYLLGKIYQQALCEAGFMVQLAATAQQALSEMEIKSPDVIVLESSLVGHGGIEFLYEVRSYPEWQTIPVVLHTMTPLTDLQPMTESLRNLAVVQHLYKPQTTLKVLTETVQDIVSKVSLSRAR